VVEAPEAPFLPVFSPQTCTVQPAPDGCRVDGCITPLRLLAFIAVFALTVRSSRTALGHITPTDRCLSVLAHFRRVHAAVRVLFLTFAEATPGMRYARIAFCTFNDDNPTRAAIRRRIWPRFCCLSSWESVSVAWLDTMAWAGTIASPVMYQRQLLSFLFSRLSQPEVFLRRR